jgi:hypothetical protein
MIPDNDPELADAALAALLIAAGREGAWHQGWTDAPTAALARRTTDQLAAVFYRYQYRHDQQLPLEPLADCRAQPTSPKRLHQADTDAAAEDRHRSHNATRTSDRRAIDRRVFALPEGDIGTACAVPIAQVCAPGLADRDRLGC